MTRMIILALLLQLALSTNDAAFTESKDNMDTVQMLMNAAGQHDHDRQNLSHSEHANRAQAHPGNHSAMSAIHSKLGKGSYGLRRRNPKGIYGGRRRNPLVPNKYKWSTSAVSRSCNTSCGISATTLYGSVTCKSVKPSWSIFNPDYPCTNLHLPKPKKPSLTCAATSECVKWLQGAVTQTCSTTCATRGVLYEGPVTCVSSNTGEIRSDSKCLDWSLAKPAPLTLECATIPRCVKWFASDPNGQCQSKPCNTPAYTNYGEVYCKQSAGTYSTVRDSECENFGLTKPSKKLKDCPAMCKCDGRWAHRKSCCRADNECCWAGSSCGACCNSWRRSDGCPWAGLHKCGSKEVYGAYR